MPEEFRIYTEYAVPMVEALMREDANEFNRIGEMVWADRAPEAPQMLVIGLAGMAQGLAHTLAELRGLESIDDRVAWFKDFFKTVES